MNGTTELTDKTAETKVTGGVSLTGKITHIFLAVLYSIANWKL